MADLSRVADDMAGLVHRRKLRHPIYVARPHYAQLGRLC